MKHEHIPRLLPNAVYPTPQLEQRERYSITDGQTGWKAAWFGPLGFLAKKMIAERQSKEDYWNRTTTNKSSFSTGIHAQHYLVESSAVNNHTSIPQQVWGPAAPVFGWHPTNLPSFPIHPSVQQAQIEFLQQMQQQSMKRTRMEEKKNDATQKRAKR